MAYTYDITIRCKTPEERDIVLETIDEGVADSQSKNLIELGIVRYRGENPNTYFSESDGGVTMGARTRMQTSEGSAGTGLNGVRFFARTGGVEVGAKLGQIDCQKYMDYQIRYIYDIGDSWFLKFIKLFRVTKLLVKETKEKDNLSLLSSLWMSHIISFILKIVTADIFSPLIIWFCMGLPPLYLGSSDG